MDQIWGDLVADGGAGSVSELVHQVPLASPLEQGVNVTLFASGAGVPVGDSVVGGRWGGDCRRQTDQHETENGGRSPHFEWDL